MHVRRLQMQWAYTLSHVIAMDETPVWADMVSGTTIEKTGTKDVPLKTSGHEKVKVTVCLTARGNGRKLNPFIVFTAAKRESKALHEEFKSQCSISSSGNGWMNEELTLRWVKEILGRFSFNKRLLAWDTYECHMTDNVKQELKDYKIDSASPHSGRVYKVYSGTRCPLEQAVQGTGHRKI